MPTINSYHNSHVLARTFYATNKRGQLKVMAEPGQIAYYGVELEVERGGSRVASCENMATRLKDQFPNRFAFEHDSSVGDGFEIISEPATIKAHLSPTGIGWSNMLLMLEAAGYQSHDGGRCGLHVHVSRAGLGSRPETIDKVS